ncbi:MAG: hypothetical protein GY906_36970 [bacterium]|nr:hypothetical protein [bacterium]
MSTGTNIDRRDTNRQDTHLPSVWVTNYAGHNYELAEEYGEVKPITVGHINMRRLDRMLYSAAEMISHTHKDDWLLLSGKDIVSATCAIAWIIKHRVCRMLVWDTRDEDYKILRLTIDSIEKLYETILLHGGKND